MIDTTALTPGDWPLWRSLRLQALTESPAAFGSTLAGSTGANDTERRWRDRLESVPLNVVLTVDGAPAGMVSATAPGRDGAIELISLWVAPFARGRGVGDAAVDCVLTWVRAHHGQGATTLCVKADNVRAIQLYYRHGFVDAGPSPDDATERLMRTDARRTARSDAVLRP